MCVLECVVRAKRGCIGVRLLVQWVLPPFSVRMSAWFRGQGCNQTAGRLPRLLGSTGVGSDVCLCLRPSLWTMTERGICCVYILVCLCCPKSPQFAASLPRQLDTVLSVPALNYGMQLSQYWNDCYWVWTVMVIAGWVPHTCAPSCCLLRLHLFHLIRNVV